MQKALSEGEKALQFVGVIHLSFILNGKRQNAESNRCPIRCRKCGGTFTKTSDARLICNNKKKRGIMCNNSCAFGALKAYLMDLYNHQIIETSSGSNNEPFITFKKEGKSVKLNFFSPNKEDLKRKELFEPLSVAEKFLISPNNLRSYFCCEYDYYRPNIEDKEILDLEENLFSTLNDVSKGKTSAVSEETSTETKNTATSSTDDSSSDSVKGTPNFNFKFPYSASSSVSPAPSTPTPGISPTPVLSTPASVLNGKRKRIETRDEDQPILERFLFNKDSTNSIKELNEFDIKERGSFDLIRYTSESYMSQL
eukprot:jgi/Orpsp1_1/1187726/evm.model.d7180000059693.2